METGDGIWTDDMKFNYELACHDCKCVHTFHMQPGAVGTINCPFCDRVLYSKDDGAKLYVNDVQVPGRVISAVVDGKEIVEQKPKTPKKPKKTTGLAPACEFVGLTDEQNKAARDLLSFLS